MLSLFDKKLKDIVIEYRRANDKKGYLAQTIQEVKQNLADQDFEKKRSAAEILIFLHLEGVPIDFAAFNCIQLMSGKKLNQRRIGFLIGTIALQNKTEILILTAGTFKKIFIETFAPQNISIGLNCLSII